MGIKRQWGKKLAIMPILVSLMIMSLIGFFPKETVQAGITRTVKVAFFPMDGYNEILDDGSRSGMDVEYLKNLCSYVNWNIEYVDCQSWEEALEKLKNKEVDLVGSAQYSEERARVYDYADLSSGYTYGVIAVNGNAAVAYEDFARFSGITFGMVKGYVRGDDFYQYLESKGVKNLDVREYATTEELCKALESGEIDAMVHSLTEVREGMRIVGEFSPKPFYYITYKGNASVLHELNQAIADMNLNEPLLENDLMTKYYSSRQDGSVVFTINEQYYIQSKGKLKIGYYDNFYPFSYVDENGDFAGLSRNLIDDMLKAAGMSAEYVLLESYLSAEQAFKNGDIDMLCYCNIPEEDFEDCKLVTSETYAVIPVAMVVNKNSGNRELRKIAIVPGLETEAGEALEANAHSFVEYTSQKECLEALSNGEVDAAICDGYLMEYWLGTEDAYSDFNIESVFNIDHELKMVMSSQNTDSLQTVVKKSLGTISDKKISEFIIGSNSFSSMGISEFIKRYSTSIVSVLLILVFLGITAAMHLYRDSRKIKKLMYKDLNLDVWNMNYFIFQTKNMISSFGKEKYGIMIFKVSQFRLYNSLYGRKTGDKLLEKIVVVLNKELGKNREVFARENGDRFALFIREYTDADLQDRVEDIKESLEKSILDQLGVDLSILVGMYIMPEGDKDVEEAISNATLALDAAKEGNGNNKEIIYYDQKLAESLRENHEREQLLKVVNIEDNFTAYYQAKVDIRSSRIVGAEALVRFLDPTENGVVRAPYFFVPYYERTGKIVEIDFFVLKSVCKMLRRRLDAGEPVVPISCNFSRHNFVMPGFCEKFEAVLEKYDVPKDLVEVEITETVIMEELQRRVIKENISELNEKGVHISIDDFGSGYSSLGVFEQIPASVIKLDRSFLLNQEDRGRQISIMKGIVHMAKDLNAQVVCEGVENDADVVVMQEIEAHIAQGYKYSKPIPENEFEKILSVGLT